MNGEPSLSPDRRPKIPVADDTEVGLEQTPPNEIIRGLRESQPSYLQRAGEAVTRKMKEQMGILFDPARFPETKMSSDVREMIKTIMTEALKPQESVFNPSKNEKALQKIANNITYHDKGDLTDSASFDQTQRARKFFENQPGQGAAKRETYWNTLCFPYNTEATRTFAKKLLDGKKIVLLGGGRSRITEELQEHDIQPRQIVNVDPFVDNVQEGADRVIPLSASDEHSINKLSEQGIENVDEIWAEYSVPAYVEDSREIKNLLQNIDALLKPGGSARIWPLQVSGRGAESDLLARKNAWIGGLEKINETKKYEFIVYDAAGRHGLILHKLPPSNEEVQKREDEEKLKEIRAQLG